MDQAAHYIHQSQPKVSHSRRVVLSTSLNVQLHVLLVGENEEDIEDEAYELWEEEMLEEEEDEEEEGIDEQVVKLEKDINNSSIDAKNKETLPPPQQQQQQESPIVTHVNNHAEDILRASTATATPPAAAVVVSDILPDPTNSKVLRVFAGNVDVGASYHSLRVNESTTVSELLSNAMEKFHISEIETKHGYHPSHSSCVEYYLTVKTRDGDEITLDAQDKPFAIYESLTAHLTTPMPSLTQFRQLANATNNVHHKKKKKRASIASHTGGDSTLQFFMHKRIKRVNDKNGQIHLKISLMTSTRSQSTHTAASPEKMNPIKKMTSLRFSSRRKKSKKELERIDKLIAIPASVTIADLTSIALVKFHIISDKDQPHQYRIILNAKGKGITWDTYK